VTEGTDPADDDGAAEDRTDLGLRMMAEVYETGFVAQAQAAPTPYMAATINQLFGEVWSRPGLSIRDRRLITIGVIAAFGRQELLEVQFRSALAKGELTPAQIDEIVLHLAYYVGWPNGTGAMYAARAATQAAAPAGETP
jgi:4-carboxymuconolactone decarboxylase